MEERILYFAVRKLGFASGDVFSGENFLTLVNIILLKILNSVKTRIGTYSFDKRERP